jgi:hypothetical protein
MNIVLGSYTLYKSSDLSSTHGRGAKKDLVLRLEQLRVLHTHTSIYTSANLPVFLAVPSPSAHIGGCGENFNPNRRRCPVLLVPGR